MNRLVSLLIPLVTLLNFFLFIVYRKVNLDEGWYLWASKLVYQGELLYRDFTYTQTPLLPYVYGAWQLAAGEGLVAGRVLTGIFGLLTAVVGGLLLQRRLAGRSSFADDTSATRSADLSKEALLVYGALFATSVYTIAYLSYTATYGLAGLLLVAGFAFAVDTPAQERYSARKDGVVAGLLTLAASTRLSALPALPVFVLYRLWRSPHRLQSLAWMAAATSTIVAVLGYFAYVSDAQMLYDIFGFHTDRTPSMLRQFWRMIRTLNNTGLAYAVPLLLMAGGAIAAAIRLRTRGSFGEFLRENHFEIALVASSVGSLLLHLWPRTTDAYYNTLLMPTWLILAAIAWTHVGQRRPLNKDTMPAKQVSVRLLPIAVIALGNLVLHGIAVHRNDLFQIPPVNQIAAVKEAAEFLANVEQASVEKNNNGTDSGKLLTLNTHLALESGMEVPSGYEMSVFAYRPDWETKRAQQFKVVNNEMLIEDLAAGVDAVAVTDFDLERFYGERQQIFDTLNSHYRLAKTVPGFDPFYNNLHIYLPPQSQGLVPQESLVVDLENGISLLGYDVGSSSYRPGQQVYVGLYWQTKTPLEQTYTVFMHLLDPNGNDIYGWDNPPCRATCPTSSWHVNETIRDEYTLEIPADAAAGIYQIRTGMYHSDTGNPVFAVTQNESVQDGRLIVFGALAVEN